MVAVENMRRKKKRKLKNIRNKKGKSILGKKIIRVISFILAIISIVLILSLIINFPFDCVIV